MERRDRATRRPPLSKRSPREEVVEILAEALWTMICQGRGPAAGRFHALQDGATSHDDIDENTTHESSPNA